MIRPKIKSGYHQPVRETKNFPFVDLLDFNIPFQYNERIASLPVIEI